jgi:hypothetical protein
MPVLHGYNNLNEQFSLNIYFLSYKIILIISKRNNDFCDE